LAKRKQAATTTKRRKTSKQAKGPAEAQLTPRIMQDAADRARDWLGQQRDYHGYLSRCDSGRGAPELGGHLRGDLQAKQGPDGSWEEEDLGVTVEALWQLLDLGLLADAAVVDRALDWMYSRRDVEGAFGSGCTPVRHEQRVCEHFLTGFFSPGESDEPQEIMLSNGQVVSSDTGARLLISERALRTALRARPLDPRATASISGLRGLPLYLEYGGSFTPAVLVGAVQALAWVKGAHSAELDAGLELLATAQEKDGGWPNVEFFFVLEALLETRHPLSTELLTKAAGRLVDTQHKYGAWGRNYVAAQTWIAVQALERVLEARRRP
jgi:hypothetical protein